MPEGDPTPRELIELSEVLAAAVAADVNYRPRQEVFGSTPIELLQSAPIAVQLLKPFSKQDTQGTSRVGSWQEAADPQDGQTGQTAHLASDSPLGKGRRQSAVNNDSSIFNTITYAVSMPGGGEPPLPEDNPGYIMMASYLVFEVEPLGGDSHVEGRRQRRQQEATD